MLAGERQPITHDPLRLVRLISSEQLRSWATEAPVWDRENSYPARAIQELAGTGVMGATFSVEDGGRGATLRQVLEVIRVVAHHSGILARVVVDSNLGPTAVVITHGRHAQRKEVSASIHAGNKPAIAITEPMAGSAATELTTSVIERDGTLMLNGEKCWITGAPVSKHYVVFARLAPTPSYTGIGILLVRKDRRGISFGRVPQMMGMRGLPEGSIYFHDYPVDSEDILIPAGDGFRIGMSLYNSQRLGAAMVATGLAEAALQHAITYTNQRHQFGRPIAANQGIRWMLADMAIQVDHALTYLRAVADETSSGLVPDRFKTAMGKINAAEMAVRVTNAAIQLFGARGYDGDGPVERLCRDARMFTIGGGTTEMLRELVGKNLVPPVVMDTSAKRETDSASIPESRPHPERRRADERTKSLHE
jgi:3-sulfinopropanoyl-CoA desulfinase